MKAVQKIKAVVPLPTNGAKEFRKAKSEVISLLESARHVNVAAWDLVLDGADRAFQVAEDVATSSKEVRSAWKELADAWKKLSEDTEAVRRRFEAKATAE